MKKYGLICILLFLAMLSVTATPLLAQDSDFTCDDGSNDVLNAARAAFEGKDKEEALELVEQALNLCTGGKRSQARRLKSQIESLVSYELCSNDIARGSTTTEVMTVTSSTNDQDYSIRAREKRLITGMFSGEEP